MPRVEIQRSGSRTPESTGLNYQSPDVTTGSGLTDFGKSIGQLEQEAARQEKLSRDATYVANTGIQVQQAVELKRQERQQQYLKNPEGFSKALLEDSGKIYEQALINAPSPEARRALESQLAGFARADFSNSISWEKRRVADNYLERHSENVNILSNQVLQDPSKASQVIQQYTTSLEAASTFVSAEQLPVLRENDIKQLSRAAFLGTLNKDPNQASDLLKSESYMETFTSDEIASMQSKIETTKLANENKAEMEANKLKTRVLNDAAEEIHRASTLEDLVMVQSKLDTHLADEAIDGGEWATYSTKIEKSMSGIIENTKKIDLVEASEQTGTPLSSTDREHVKAVNQHYEDVFLPSTEGLNNSQRISKITSYTSSKGIVPDQLKTQIHSQLSGGSPEQQVNAAQLLVGISDQNAILSSQFNKDRRAYARKLVEHANAGLNPEEAVEAAKVQVFEKNTAQYKAKVSDFDTQRVDFDADELPVDFDDTPDNIPVLMQDEWNMVYSSLFLDQNMSEETARQEAYQRVADNWGVTSIAGESRWMKDAPEVRYGIPDVSNDWMRKQLKQDIMQSLSIDEDAAEERLDEVTLMKNDLVKSSDGPVYNIMINTDSGIVFLPDSKDKNKPALWKPVFADTPEGKLTKVKSLKEKTKAMEDNLKAISDNIDRQERKSKRTQFKQVQEELDAEAPSLDKRFP